MRHCLWITALLMAALSVPAQFSDSLHYFVSAGSSGNYNRTNTSSAYLFSNSARFGVKKKDISLNSTNKWLYGMQNEKLTNNDVSSVLDFNLYKTLPHFYYWGLGNFSRSHSLKVNRQFQAGAGVAYNVVDRKQLVVNVSDGLVYEYSDIRRSDSVNEIYSTPRNSFRLQVKWSIKDRLVFSGNGFLQHSLLDGSDYIVKSDLSLSVKLRKWLSLTSALSYNSISRTKGENLFVTYGINFERYF